MYKVYQVINGDTLKNIASRLNITENELKQLNGLMNDNIIPGSYLIVPNNNMMSNNMGTNNEYEVYIVKQGDNVYAIAREYGVDYKTLLAINGLKDNEYIYPNQEILIPKSNVYVTGKNDTIEDIINRLNVTYEDLKNKNKNIYLVEDQMIKY